MSANLYQLTGVELDRAAEAVAYLLGPIVQTTLDPRLRIQLNTYRTELKAEQEERRELAKQ